MLNNAIYQKIFDKVSKYLWNDWNKLVVYLEYGDGSYSFTFYIKDNENYINCFDIPGVSEDELFNTFSEIDGIVSPERDKLDAPWRDMTMIVDSDGDMHTDFRYADNVEDVIEYRQNWKKIYLK